MSTEKELIYANPFRRGIANAIDIIIVALLRIASIQILAAIWLNKIMEKIAQDYKEFYGTQIVENVQQLSFFIKNHQDFNHLIAFFVIVIFIGAFYHAILNSSSWKATIGKRIMSVMIVNSEYEKINILKALCHYFMSLVPIILLLQLVSFMSVNDVAFVNAITGNMTNLLISFIAVMWFNLQYLTKKKTTAQDLICSTLFVNGRSKAKNPFSKLSDDEI